MRKFCRIIMTSESCDYTERISFVIEVCIFKIGSGYVLLKITILYRFSAAGLKFNGGECDTEEY